MDEMEGKQVNKTHRKSQSGKKADKKKAKSEHEQSLTPKQRNPKAFAIQNPVRAERRFRRTMDVDTKRQHIPLIDRTPIEPPPLIVALVGPPKVGKTTLLRCLIKNFTRQNLSDILGPVTVVSGKKRRLTLLECNNDLNTMIDVAKVADLVLLLVDANFGFEMETFEFLNICQAHGFPRIMGVLTHLDFFRNSRQLKKRKKNLKHRFWTEIYPGAKLFCLSGMVHGEYPKSEVHNLGRFISVIKLRPLQFRVSHPYVLADRFEDLTDPEELRQRPTCDRVVCFYGYTRGANFKHRNAIHIPGCGDFYTKEVSFLPDPCPLPDKEKKRSLSEKEKLIYAPMSGVGGIVYDKDAVYIDLGGSHSHKNTDVGPTAPINELVASLVESRQTLDAKMGASTLQIFKDAAHITSEEVEGNPRILHPEQFSEENEFDDDHGDEDNEGDVAESDDDSDEEIDFSSSEENVSDRNSEMSLNEITTDSSYKKTYKRKRPDYEQDDKEVAKKAKLNDDPSFKATRVGAGESLEAVAFDDDTDDENDIQEESNVEGELRWKVDLAKKAADAFYRRQKETPNLRKLVYGKATEAPDSEKDDKEEIEGLFKVARDENREKKSQLSVLNSVDCSKFLINRVQDWGLPEVQERIRDCFVTGKWNSKEDASALLDDDDDEEIFGDFEDLETGEVHRSNSNDVEGDDDAALDEGERTVPDEKSAKARRLEKKKRLKEKFNVEYDDDENETSYYNELKTELDEQSQLNKSEFANMDDSVRVNYEGFRPGMYVRVEVENVPCEFIKNFDPSYPVILGGLLSGENNIGFVQTRLKKHRWYNKILKTRDPLIISLGWRRFQTMPLFSIQDHNGRNRLLKYTPEHLHCVASFWGPITPQGSGLIAIQNVADITANFRIAASGVVTELDKSTQVVKKLKLTGTPYKIYKKTAFVKGMFNTALEVSKFEGAAIRTVSGIRGQIKKADKNPEGAFRATFEDKIVLSDIVFMRTWFKVQMPQFYNPVTNLLLLPEEKAKWRGMRTVGQLRHDLKISVPRSDDSIYKPVVRVASVARPLPIPRHLQNELPYKSKTKLAPKIMTHSLQQKRLAVIKDPHEQKISKLMTMIKSVYNEKQKKEREAMRERVTKHKKELAAIEAKSKQKQKITKKQICRNLGKMEKKKTPQTK